MTCIRMKAFSIAASLAIAGAAFAAASARAETKYATKEAFVAAVAGKTIATTTKAGKTFAATYDAKGGGMFELTGMKPAKFTWSYKGDTLCSVFKSIKFTECNKVEIVSPTEFKFYDAKSGALNNDYKVK